MKRIAQLDENGNATLLRPEDDDYILQDNEINIEVVGLPEGFHLPKWDGTEWVEGKSQEEIDTLINAPTVPTQVDRLRALEDTVTALLGL